MSDITIPAAVIEAWPGLEFAEGVYCGQPYKDLILPLTEASDE